MEFFTMFKAVITKVFGFFNIPIILGGFTITLWQVFAFTILAPLAFYFVGYLLSLIKNN